MIGTIDTDEMLKVIENIAKTVEENKDYLTRLDSEIGDGDLSINLNRGFTEVRRKLAQLKGKDAGTILKTVGSTLIESVGGAVGPLYGVAFMKAGGVVEGKLEIDLSDLVRMFEVAEQGIVGIGSAKLGEKTMLDAVHPAVEALKEAASKNYTLLKAFEQSVKAAERGMKNTIQMVAKKGRSMYLGERARGHQDVGATSCYLMLKSVLDTLKMSRQLIKK